MTPKRNHALAIRLRDPFFAAHWREAIQRTAASPFCTGKSERGWRANLDWFLTAGSVEKILEGNYDAKPARVAQRPIASVNFNQTNFRASL